MVNGVVAFYKATVGAEEVNRLSNPKRKADQELPLLLSVEMKLYSSTIMTSDLADDSTAPVKASDMGLVFCLETEDIEAAVEKAVKVAGHCLRKFAGEVVVVELDIGEVR
ncbi:putative glyoxalase/Bleomycin resistance protein/Dihydroxybiphenyl dioxygenase [Helianthus anomalus]